MLSAPVIALLASVPCGLFVLLGRSALRTDPVVFRRGTAVLAAALSPLVVASPPFGAAVLAACLGPRLLVGPDVPARVPADWS